MSQELRAGLEGVVVAESSLSYIDGSAGRLLYRGYSIEDLAEHASFEEVVYLLWRGTLPNETQLEELRSSMASQREISRATLELLADQAAADEKPMAALRTAVSSLSSHDPADSETNADDREANLAKGTRITAKVPTIIAAFDRLRNGEEPIDPDPELSHAANFLYMLTGDRPSDVTAAIMDTALVLHADHGLNASTFSAMVTASTLADLHAAITSAVGTLSGELHGGANENVMRMLKEIDDASVEPKEWVDNALESGRRIPGFGHRVYDVTDPRANILRDHSKTLGEHGNTLHWYESSQEIESYLGETKGLAANVDFYSASTYHQMGISMDLFTPIFALSRVSGWIAHVLEQYDDNRLIRPRARYVGSKDERYVPLAER